MFEQSMLTKANGGRRAVSTCLGVTGEAVLLAGVVIAPMVWPQVLPRPKDWISIYTPTVPRPLGGANLKKTHVEPRVRPETPRGFWLPVSMPKVPGAITDEPVADVPDIGDGVVGAPGPGFSDGVRNAPNLMNWMETRPAPTYKEPETRAAAATPREAPPSIRIRVSNGVQEAKLLVCVKPAYPPLARAARVSGTVELDAVIGRDGRLAEVQVKSGNALLIQAALSAVRQWVYKPTYLNGDPVEVSTTILVNFTLAQ
jgi:protein TonB